MYNNKSRVFHLLAIVIILLVVVLITVNLLYIKNACSAKGCIFSSLLSIILLVWATLFWMMVTKHSDKK
ncbi:MAG: hypothetical protein Q8O12_00735 [Candidatus Omnitrophota bacterium]|nr:hypothetical protein [Candidatus Omnitrophota bacterium]